MNVKLVRILVILILITSIVFTTGVGYYQSVKDNSESSTNVLFKVCPFH